MLSSDTIRETFRLHKERQFLVDSNNSKVKTYWDVERTSAAFAGKLVTAGVGQGDRVGIILSNSMELATVYFSCLYLGAVAVPINPALNENDIEYLLENCGARVFVFSRRTQDRFGGNIVANKNTKIITLHVETDDGKDAPNGTLPLVNIESGNKKNWVEAHKWDLNAAALIVFTSGTTSRPKGVVHSLGGLIANAIAFNDAHDFSPKNRFFHVFHMSYLAGYFNNLLSPFLAGASVVIAQPFEARTALRFWEIAQQFSVNTFWLAPPMLAALTKLDRSPVSIEFSRTNIKTVCVGTAPLPLSIKKAFEAKYGIEVFESYGLSETLFVTTSCAFNLRAEGSVGQAISGVRVYAVDEAGVEVKPGIEGELVVTAESNMIGYLDFGAGSVVSTSPQREFLTGDIGYVSHDGLVFVTGRLKDVIIRGGTNISPRAIEELILSQDYVDSQVAVIGLPHDFYGEEITAIVKLKNSAISELVLECLEKVCREKLTPEQVPTRFLFVDEFPVNATGKINKVKLRNQLLAQVT